ncbi:hypothetical protein GCM10029963_22260 [Micromonospora andamanensis]
MLSAAPTRPLWWLARWAARLLTGFAVAAAFTLGAWSLPGEAAPAGQLAAPPVVAAAPQASVERDLTAPSSWPASRRRPRPGAVTTPIWAGCPRRGRRPSVGPG